MFEFTDSRFKLTLRQLPQATTINEKKRPADFAVGRASVL
jgi:hypothetical protein